ncbi:MAG: iron ABC transporter permease [Chloroflexi bacterium]|nr:iron ABC transporter permease [Chloroflexota bacterium]
MRYVAIPCSILRHLRPYVLVPFLGLLALFLAYPIFMVVYASFKGGPPGVDTPFSFEGYTRAWSEWATYKALITTFALAVPRVLTGVIFAIFATWIITRTNTPLRWFFEEMIWLKLFLPILPMVMAWLLIAGGRSGVLNKFLMDVLNLSKPPLDIQSYWGVIFYSFMLSGSFFFLYMAPAFRNMDASLEESSRVSGASNIRTLFRITVPMMMPAILGVTLLVFLFVLSSYEIELFFLAPKGAYVFSTWIWWEASKIPPDYPSAMAMSSVFLIFVAIVIYLQSKILGGRQFVTVTGRGFGVRLLDLGKWRWAAFAFMASWTLVGLVLPMVMLILGTVQNAYGVLGSGYTLDYWREALGRPSIIRSFRNTLMLGFMAASAGVILYGLMSYIYIRTRLRGRQLIEILSWVPRAAPGVVLSLGIAWAALGGIPGLDFLYGSLFLMAAVILLEATPQGMRMMNGGMVQLSAELEEASRVSGGSWSHTMRRVVVPLLMPTLLHAWLLIFRGATSALVVLLFIYRPSSKVLAIDIFERMLTNQPQQAAILGVLLTAISMVVAIVARVLAFRQRRSLEIGGGV